MTFRDNGYAVALEKPLVDGPGGYYSPRNPVFHDHFLDDTLNTFWSAVAVNGTSAAGSIAAEVAGGALALVTGTDDNGIAVVAGPIIWAPANGEVFIEARVKLSAITTVAATIGLVDAKSYTNELPFNENADTYESNAADGVAWYFDTDSTAPATDVWTATGVDTDVDVTRIDGAAPVADTYETLRIEISASGVAKFLQNGVIKAKIAASTTPATLLCPLLGVAARAGAASRTFSVDYVTVGQKLI